MKKDNKRVDYMDIAKGLGIILVVLGHSNSPFTNFIYLFHMSLFFFISGYFYKEEYSYNPIILIKKRIKTLYIPYVLYETFFLITHNLFMRINIYSPKVVVNNIVGHEYTRMQFIKGLFNNITFGGSEQLVGTFWFIVVLFMVNVLFCITSFIIVNFIKVKRELIRFGMMIVCFVVGNILTSSHIFLPRYLNISLVVILIYYFGYLYKIYEDKIRKSFGLFVLCIVGLIICNSFGTIRMSDNYYTNPLFFIAVSLFGIYTIIYISKYLSSLSIKFKLVIYLGNSTMSIMALHLLSFKIVNLIQIITFRYPIYFLAKTTTISGNNGWWFLYTIVGLSMPTFIHFIFVKFKDYSKNKNTDFVISE